MAYQIVKGWPSAGALDEVLVVKAGATGTDLVTAGGIITQQVVADGGEVSVVVSPAAASPVEHYFVIDIDVLVTNQSTGLAGDFIVEVDNDHVNGADTSAFTVGDLVSSDAAGKFTITTTEQPIGKCLNTPTTSGDELRIRWTA